MDFKATSWSCSFCGAQGGGETRLAGGLGAMICMDCLDHYHHTYLEAAQPERVAPESDPAAPGGSDAVASVASPQWESMTDAELLSRLPMISAESGQVDRFLRQWVKLIRQRRISYAEIGKALGVSRQAAWERFSRVVDADDEEPHPQARSGSA